MKPTDRLPWTSLPGLLSVLTALAIIFIGARFLIAPLVGAEGYGIPVQPSEADAFLRAKGARDIASGLFILCLLAFAPPRVVGLFLLAATFIPLADALIVANGVGPQPVPLMIHGGTALFMLILSLVILRGASVQGAGSRAKDGRLPEERTRPRR